MNGALRLSITGFSCYFSFSRISSALMPSASSFFRTDSASVFFASSAALASALAFFASSLTIHVKYLQDVPLPTSFFPTKAVKSSKPTTVSPRYPRKFFSLRVVNLIKSPSLCIFSIIVEHYRFIKKNLGPHIVVRCTPSSRQ